MCNISEFKTHQINVLSTRVDGQTDIHTMINVVLCVELSCARYKIVLERKREIELSIELNQQHRSSLIKLILNVKI